MIIDYHKPNTLDEALALLNKPKTLPLGGGTVLSKATPDPVSVVDLQRLGLDALRVTGSDLVIGATCTLQSLLEFDQTPAALRSAIKLEAPLNLRNTATAAGALVAGDGRSTFVTMLLALDAKIEQKFLEGTEVKSQTTGISDFILTHPKGLITSVTIPLNTKTAFDYVSRTPADKPIVCAALAQWNSGRSRLALGGYGKNPLLAMDGTEGDGVDIAASNAYHEAADEYASAEYRMETASVLAKRCMESLG